jgi:hypothetical protein
MTIKKTLGTTARYTPRDAIQALTRAATVKLLPGDRITLAVMIGIT